MYNYITTSASLVCMDCKQRRSSEMPGAGTLVMKGMSLALAASLKGTHCTRLLEEPMGRRVLGHPFSKEPERPGMYPAVGALQS